MTGWNTHLRMISRQLRRKSPFGGTYLPSAVPLFSRTRSTLPFPHPWNFQRPLDILAGYFSDADTLTGAARHNRYLDVPGFAPVLVTRDPAVIRAIATETGDAAAAFERDPLPSSGIARATGKDTLLYANGSIWKTQRKAAASPFGKTSLFVPERFATFESTFRGSVSQRLIALDEQLRIAGQTTFTVALEPEVKAVMLELLCNCFFGCQLSYQDLRQKYVPALERVIDHIVRDTVMNRLGFPVWRLPGWTPRLAQRYADFQCFEELTDHVLAGRQSQTGLWAQFRSDAPDDALRANLKVFLAGALEATTSFATWAIAHLARHPAVQEQVHAEVQQIAAYTPDSLAGATGLGHVLEETLRLTPSLYFLPRRATRDVVLTLGSASTLEIPAGTHVLLDVWHANRHEDHWGVAATGFPAVDFAPQRWPHMAAQGRPSKETLHFGFGHGPRVCPGKHLGQLEVALVVGAVVKLFRLHPVHPTVEPRVGVSTKPADGTLVVLERRPSC